MVARLVTGLALVALFKIVVRYTLIGTFTPAVVLLFAIVDTAMILVMVPWASMGRPLPVRGRALLRALLVAFASTLVLALVNTMLQIPQIYGKSADLFEVVFRIGFEAFPGSFFPSPLGGSNLFGGLLVALIATLVGWVWMSLRLPKASRPAARAGPGGPARVRGGARPAAGGRTGRAPSPQGGRRPR
jgi:hypothetical protein